MAKLMKTLELDYPMIQVLIMSIGLQCDYVTHSKITTKSHFLGHFFKPQVTSCCFHEGILFMCWIGNSLMKKLAICILSPGQTSHDIIHVVKRPKTFVIADDNSPAVAQAKSPEQWVPSSFGIKMWTLNAKWPFFLSWDAKCDTFAIPQDKLVKVCLFSGNWFVGGMCSKSARELVEDRMDKGMDQKEKQKRNVKIGGRIASGGHCRLQQNVPHELWNISGNIDRYRAFDYQNSWPKNYHELSWSNEKEYHRLSWRIWTSSK